jgi:predicted metal-dependent hydrolase
LLGVDETVETTFASADPITYRIRRSERARRVRITVDPTRGVEVVLPRRAAEREAAAAVPLHLRPEAGRTRVHLRGDELLVPAADHRPALERWYRRAARIEIAPRLDRTTAEAGTRYTKLTIRGQQTRWASCSRAGAMSFNWRLLLAPEPVLDYVVWHEVCHLEIMDHSPRFWALLASRCPDYRTHRRWLRRHGTTLVL